MRKILIFLACLSFLVSFSACSSRTAPPQDIVEKPNISSENNENSSLKEDKNIQNNSEKKEEIAEKVDENSSENQESEEIQTENEEILEEKTEELPSNTPSSGTFKLLNSDYQITLSTPLVAALDENSQTFYINSGNSAVKGVVSYTTDADEVKAIEDNISALNEALKNDKNVHDFEYERNKDKDGLYSIVFYYRTSGDEYSEDAYTYVLYKQTPNGLLNVMFNCQDTSYDAAIDKVFKSVVPATDEAKNPPVTKD